MLTARERARRSSSGFNKDKIDPLGLFNLNVAEVYGTEKKAKHQFVHMAKGKQNVTSKIKIQKENFPKGVISFKNTNKESRKSMSKSFLNQSGIKQTKISKDRKRKASYKNDDSWTLNPDKYPNQKKNTNGQKQIAKQHKESNIKSFKEALRKIFKGLDIFNRGTITETNINKWIPEQALYFLGNIFQKIRQERLNLSQQQFVNQCMPILSQTTPEDLKHFLQSVNGKDINNVSISFSSEKQLDSPVQYKINKDTNMEEYRRSKYKPLIPFDELVAKKDTKEVKDRAKVINKEEVGSKKLPYFSNTVGSVKEVQCLRSGQKARIIREAESKNQHKISEKSPYQQKKTLLQDLNLHRDIELKVPIFNFQLPKEQTKFNLNKQTNFSIKRQQDSHSKRLEAESIRKTFDLSKKEHDVANLRIKQFDDILLRNKPFETANIRQTSRIVHQNIPRQQIKSARASLIESGQSERIDNLSHRLQQYILLNHEKIERNRNFIRQNSVPRPGF